MEDLKSPKPGSVGKGSAGKQSGSTPNDAQYEDQYDDQGVKTPRSGNQNEGEDENVGNAEKETDIDLEDELEGDDANAPRNRCSDRM